MARWTAYPYAGSNNFDASIISKQWKKLHAGDLEPLPTNPQVLQAWIHFHNGDFHKAATLGHELGYVGLSVYCKATCTYATYLEKHEDRRLELFLQVAKLAEQWAMEQPENFNAHYWWAFALGRYSQGLSVAKALAQGLDNKVKSQLENVIRQQPRHADAHLALGNFHAETIDKVGSLIGAMAYGVNKDIGLKLFTRAIQLNNESPRCMVEHARALLMLEGDKMMDEATTLYQLAARTRPRDAMERLEVEMAKAELDD
jgi:tetratricopeptide (TPR) repeat protein